MHSRQISPLLTDSRSAEIALFLSSFSLSGITAGMPHNSVEKMPSLFKTLGWASVRDGLLFEIIFAISRGGLPLGGMRQILKLTTNYCKQ